MQKIQSFQRYEFKYLLTKKLSTDVESEIKNFMKYDLNIDKKFDNRYFVRSLYFDNSFSSNFYEKVDGMMNRNKYRLRTYSKENNKKNPIFLEMKGRVNQRTYKIRTKIDPSHLKLFFDKTKIFKLLNIYSSKNIVIKNFVFDFYRKNISPVVLVDYRRRPYINTSGLNFRLTFDSQIMSTKTSNLFENNNFLSWQECRAGYTILEVKFERSITPWFHRVIQNYNLNRLSISKFVIGMEQCKIASETSV